MANQNVTQLTQQTVSANATSLFYAVTGGSTDTGLPLSVLVNNLGLTGTPTVPTATTGTNTTQIASTAFVQAQNTATLAAYAQLASPSFTGTVTVTGTISGTGFSSYLASPPAIGGTAPNAGSFTTLTASSTVSGAGFTALLAPYALLNNPTFTGTTTVNAITASGAVGGTGFDGYLGSPPAIGTTAPAAGKFTTLQATGAITPSQTAGIVGTTTNNSANAGSVGEYVNSTVLSGAPVSLTSNTAANITSISLTAGDWDVWGQVVPAPAGGTTITQARGAITTTTAAIGSYGDVGSSLLSATQAVATASIVTIVPIRLLLASTTTVFLVGQATFTGSTCTAFGYISARRRR